MLSREGEHDGSDGEPEAGMCPGSCSHMCCGRKSGGDGGVFARATLGAAEALGAPRGRKSGASLLTAEAVLIRGCAPDHPPGSLTLFCGFPPKAANSFSCQGGERGREEEASEEMETTSPSSHLVSL